METSIWFRNPDRYVREIVDAHETRFVWDRTFLVKKEIDPTKWGNLHYNTTPWEALVIGNAAVHIDNEHTLSKPLAVYPVWEYGDELDLLEEMLAQPAGQNVEACGDKDTPVEERPVANQEHIVVITKLPNASTGPGRRFMRQLKEIHEDYPEATLHIHGLQGFRVLFGMKFGSGDFDPTEITPKDSVVIPAGTSIPHQQLIRHPQWVRVLGFNPVDLQVPRNRVIFNIKSAVWAAKYWEDQIAPKTQSNAEPDTTSPDAAYYPPTVGRGTITARKGAPGDKVVCNECSLAITCKFFRTDSICTVPKTETQKLSAFFGTRNADDIIDGLDALVKKNAERLDDALDTERAFGDINPETGKQIGQLFDQGVKLAKLLDPALRAGPKVQVNVGQGGQASVQVGDTRQLVAQAYRELEAQGIPRDQITPAMIEAVLTGGPGGTRSAAPERAAIQGTVVRRDDDLS